MTPPGVGAPSPTVIANATPSAPVVRAPYGNGSTAIRRRRAPLTGRAVVLAIVLVVLALSFAYPLRGWFDQRAQLSALNEQTIAQQQKIADLQADLVRWDDPAFVETQARSRLRFVLPGEASFVVLGSGTESEATARAAEELSATGASTGLEGGAWWERLWSTVDQADAAVRPEPVEPAAVPSPGATGLTPGAARPAATDAPADGAG